MTELRISTGTIVTWATAAALRTGTIVVFVPAGIAVDLPPNADAPTVKRRTVHARYLIEVASASSGPATYYAPAATVVEQQNLATRIEPEAVSAALRTALLSEDDTERLVLSLAHVRGETGITEIDVVQLVEWARQVRLWNACINLTLGGEGVIDMDAAGEPTFRPLRWPVPTSTPAITPSAPTKRRKRTR